MLGYYAPYSREYLATLMIVTTLFFALPIFVAPIAWARLMRWRIPEHQHLAIYFGRCLGAFIARSGLLPAADADNGKQRATQRMKSRRMEAPSEGRRIIPCASSVPDQG